MMESKPSRYGAVPVTIHWLSAVFIMVVLVLGFRAADSLDPAAKAAILRFHIPIAIAVMILTLLRLIWWSFIDRKPEPVAGVGSWQIRAARLVHLALYVVILALVVTGIGTIVDSGAAPALLGTRGAVLPNFHDYPPRFLHGVGAMLLIALLLCHVASAFWHHLIRRDDLLRRMWYRA